MNTKSFRAHCAVKDATKGLAEVIVSAYGPNPDEDGDVVVKGAVAKQIAGEYGPNPKGMLDHDWSMRSAVAKTIGWWEDDDGLHIEAQYNLEKEIGRDAFSDLIFYGADMEFSVGYQVKAAERASDEDRAKGIRRYITEWQINEWSHVMLGANHETGLVSAKGRKRGEDTPDTKTIVGTYEYLREQITAVLEETYSPDWIWVRGTTADTVVFHREHEDGMGEYHVGCFQAPYTIADDGTVTVGDPTEVVISEVVEPKSAEPNETKSAEPVLIPADLVAAFNALRLEALTAL